MITLAVVQDEFEIWDSLPKEVREFVVEHDHINIKPERIQYALDEFDGDLTKLKQWVIDFNEWALAAFARLS